VIPVATSLTTEHCNGLSIVDKNDCIDAFKSTTGEGKECQSRHEILEELGHLGVNTEELALLSIEGLANLLNGFRVLMIARDQPRKPGRPKRNGGDMPVLTNADKTILHHLFSSQGHASSLKLSRELNIPLSTIQRRRKRLQDGLIETSYSLKIEKLGWRNATLLVSTASGKIETIGQEILDMSDLVSSVSRAMGGSNFDLRVEVIFKTNTDLMTLIDKIKSTEGVSGLIWSESLKLIGKRETSNKIIDSS
jgi:DNA-binding Lrp family transcriptional regulator